MDRFASPTRGVARVPPTPGAPRARRSALAAAIRATPEDPRLVQLAVVADPDEVFLPLPGGSSALGLAIECGRSPAILRELIAAGALVDGEDSLGRTPLQTLLNTEPQPDVQQGLGWGFLHRAELPYLRAHQALLVRQAIALLSAGATVPAGGVVAARGNHACALCVREYWDALLAAALRRAMLAGQLGEHWGIIVAFVYDGA